MSDTSNTAVTAEPKIKGLTTKEYDGVSLPTLRYWLRFWEGKTRAKMTEAQKQQKGSELQKLRAEINAREAARKA